MTEPSKINEKHLSIQEKLAAIRFILMIPMGEWYHIKTLPDYVFTWIYEEGCYQDLPWIHFEEDDTGQRIRRTYRMENPKDIAELLYLSSFFKWIHLEELIGIMYHEQIGVTKFEDMLFKFAKHNIKNVQI